MTKQLRILSYPDYRDAQLIEQLIQDRILRPVHREVWDRLVLDSLLPFKEFREAMNYLQRRRPMLQYLLLALLQHYTYGQILTAYAKDDYQLDEDLLTAFNCLTTYYGMNDYD